MILREGNNDGDTLAVRMVYQASGLLGIQVGDYFKTVRVSRPRSHFVLHHVCSQISHVGALQPNLRLPRSC